jgi:hypothetical protein
MTTTRLSDKAACNTCGYRIDSATGMNCDDAPNEGDISICLACGSIEVYVESPDGMVTRRTTEAEFHECMADKTVQDIVASVMLGKVVEPSWPGGQR